MIHWPLKVSNPNLYVKIQSILIYQPSSIKQAVVLVLCKKSRLMTPKTCNYNQMNQIFNSMRNQSKFNSMRREATNFKSNLILLEILNTLKKAQRKILKTIRLNKITKWNFNHKFKLIRLISNSSLTAVPKLQPTKTIQE